MSVPISLTVPSPNPSPLVKTDNFTPPFQFGCLLTNLHSDEHHRTSLVNLWLWMVTLDFSPRSRHPVNKSSRTWYSSWQISREPKVWGENYHQPPRVTLAQLTVSGCCSLAWQDTTRDHPPANVKVAGAPCVPQGALQRSGDSAPELPYPVLPAGQWPPRL